MEFNFVSKVFTVNYYNDFFEIGQQKINFSFYEQKINFSFYEQAENLIKSWNTIYKSKAPKEIIDELQKNEQFMSE